MIELSSMEAWFLGLYGLLCYGIGIYLGSRIRGSETEI